MPDANACENTCATTRLVNTHTCTRTYARTRARTHARTHIHTLGVAARPGLSNTRCRRSENATYRSSSSGCALRSASAGPGTRPVMLAPHSCPQVRLVLPMLMAFVCSKLSFVCKIVRLWSSLAAAANHPRPGRLLGDCFATAGMHFFLCWFATFGHDRCCSF
jgi:hypothetical protein